jgi:DNA-binding transcriptional LysR family regulator
VAINPRQLEAFRSVMLTGSMTLAAETLKISQPAVSRLVRDLEEVLAIRLFRREGNRLIPGAEAQRLFREVDRFYQGMDQIERVAQDLKTVRTGTLRIGSITSLGMDFLSEAIRRFLQTHPDVYVSLEIRPALGILELAAANQIDVGYVGFYGTDYPAVKVEQQWSLPAVCVLPGDHALAVKNEIELGDLQGQRLITLGKNSPLRIRLDQALEAAGVTCQRTLETTFAHAACSLVARGLGITVSDPFTTSFLKDQSLAIRPLVPVIPFLFSMIVPAHQPRPKAVQDFASVVHALITA